MSWETLNTQGAQDFINDVADAQYPDLFDTSLCEAHRLPLDYYDGYYLYRISNQYTLPYLTLDYLSNGEDHYYLDGSETPFHNLNARGALNLNERNAFDYLGLFISYVYERGNSLGFRGTFDDSKISKTDRGYEIETLITYRDKEVQALIEVSDKGVLNVKEPLNVTFMQDLKPATSPDYEHPFEPKIIEESLALLSNTPTGTRIVEIYKKHKPAIHILPSPNYQGFCTNTLKIYMCMPALEQSAKYLQAIVLSGCIIDFEQVISGYKHPHPTLNKDTYGDASIGKNLDMIKEMCKIVKEYEENNIPEGVQAIDLLGFLSVYHTYKTGADDQMLLEVYISALTELGIVT